MKIKSIVAVVVSICCLIGLFSGCSNNKENKLDVEDAVSFISESAKKTQSANSAKLEVEGFANDNSGETFMIKEEYSIKTIDNGDIIFQMKKGTQKANEPTITMKCSLNTYSNELHVYSYPIALAQHNELAYYLKKDAEAVYVGDSIYYFSCMMTHGDLNYLMTGELCRSNVDGSDINKPVMLRLYVNQAGYFCGIEYDMAVASDGSGDIYTNSIRFSEFGTALFDEELPEEIIVDSVFPEGKENNTLNSKELASIYTTRTVDDIIKYEGRLSGNGYHSRNLSIALKDDGSFYVDAQWADEYCEKLEALKEDLVYVEVFGGIIIGIKKDGSVYLNGENGSDHQWDLSKFSNLKSVGTGSKTLYGLKKNGEVVATGPNAAAVSGWSNVKQLSVFDTDVVIALKNDGTVYVSGEDDVTKASGWSDIVSVSAGRFHVVGLKSDGTVVTAGTNPLGDYGEHNVSDWSDIVGIAAGNMSTVGIRSDGSVVANGYEIEYMNKWTDVVYVDADQRWGLRYNGSIYGADDDWKIF